MQSLDIVLGTVGGFSSLVWALLFFFFGGYEDFKLQNSLISSIYPTSPTEETQDRGIDDGSDSDGDRPRYESEQEAKRAMYRSI